MSLDWNIKRVDNYLDRCFVAVTADDHRAISDGLVLGQQYLAPVTNALIWGALAVGVPEITHRNWQEYWGRFYIYDRLTGISMMPRQVNGDWMRDEAGKISLSPITAQDVRDHIGLTTNVSSMTGPAFLARLMQHVKDNHSKVGE